jgi:ribosome-binding factor A
MISPEERMGVDNVVSVMVTVADVEISNDLQVVKVFVSILGDERGKKNAINGLKKLEGYVRRNIGKKVSLRLTPEIRFVYDDSFERGQRVATLLDDLRVKREVRVANGGKYTKSELLAVEDTISNPYDDEDDGDRWTAADATDGDDDDDEGADAEGGDEDDVDIQQVWDKMQKDAEAARGEDDLINVQ